MVLKIAGIIIVCIGVIIFILGQSSYSTQIQEVTTNHSAAESMDTSSVIGATIVEMFAGIVITVVGIYITAKGYIKPVR